MYCIQCTWAVFEGGICKLCIYTCVYTYVQYVRICRHTLVVCALHCTKPSSQLVCRCWHQLPGVWSPTVHARVTIMIQYTNCVHPSRQHRTVSVADVGVSGQHATPYVSGNLILGPSGSCHLRRIPPPTLGCDGRRYHLHRAHSLRAVWWGSNGDSCPNHITLGWS